MPPTDTVTSFDPAAVDISAVVKRPFPSVAPVEREYVLLTPEALTEMACPLVGLPFASATVTVIEDLATPSATTVVGLAATLDRLAPGAPATKAIVALTLIDPMVAVTVFVPADVEDSDVAKLPVELVVPLV